MSGVKYTIAEMKRLNRVEKNGIYLHVSTLTDKPAKVKKLPNLLERAIPETITTGGTIYIKPLSTNKAWRGRRIKTDEHNSYCDAVTMLLPKSITIPDGFLKISYEFGFSSNGADLDNPLKSMTDIISKKYGFNDNRIMIATIKKVIVKKGKEYIKFNIESL